MKKYFLINLDTINRIKERHPSFDLGNSKQMQQALFSSIYDYRMWRDAKMEGGREESISGPGSSLANTTALRRELPVLIQDLQIESLLDAGCGDFNWMQHLDLKVKRYIGCDIVPKLVAHTQRACSGNNREFLVLDIVRDTLPKVDLILCKDVFIHFALTYILHTLENFKKSQSTYLLVTTNPLIKENEDAPTSNYSRSLNFQLPPFNFPEPLKVVEDPKPWATMGLWKIADL